MMNQPNSTGDRMEFADRYAQLWADREAPPNLQAFVNRCHGLDSDELAEILLVDQSFRWQHGKEMTVEQYVAQWPSLADHPELVLDLIYGELRGMFDRGDVPDQAVFAERFPQLKQQLARQAASGLWHHATQDFRDGDSAVEADQKKSPPEWADDDRESGIDPEAPIAFSDFEIGERLGGGAMGEVYRATQKSLGKLVAIKMLKSTAVADRGELVRRFLREGRTVAAIGHKNIVDVHGIGRCPDGGYFLVMDLVEGESLDRRIKTGPISCQEAVRIVAEVAGAIAHANQLGVIHRDLKPSNVLLDRAGRVKVVDFGLAKLCDSNVTACDDTALHDVARSQPGQVIGTPQFMAPEQADPERWGPVGPRTDVYGLGALLYAILVGRPPIEGDTLSELFARLVSSRPCKTPRSIRPEIPEKLETICLKCLAKDPEDRYDSAEEVHAALCHIGRNHAVPPARRQTTAGRSTWSGRLAIGASAFAVIALLAMLSMSWNHDAGTTPAPSDPPAVLASVDVTWTVDVRRAGPRSKWVRLTDTPATLVNGDKLQLQFDFSRAVHAFVFWVDGEGAVRHLHPLNSNPSEPTTRLRIPSPATHALPVIGKPGTEVCVLVLRDSPEPDSEHLAEAVRPPSAFPPLQGETILLDGRVIAAREKAEPTSRRRQGNDLPSPAAWFEGERIRGVGDAEPLDGLSALEYFRLWHRGLPEGLGDVRYMAIPHVASGD